jgi:hypothetical protein
MAPIDSAVAINSPTDEAFTGRDEPTKLAPPGWRVAAGSDTERIWGWCIASFDLTLSGMTQYRGPRRLTKLIPGAAVGVATLLASLTVATPAAAAVRTFHDRAGDTGVRADITTVRVSNSDTRVAVAARVGRINFEDFFTFWFDTVPANAGPEYKVVVFPNSDGITLKRLGSFGASGTTVSCGGLRAQADAFGEDLVRVSVPRSCMRNPGAVRVSLRARYKFPERTIADWAPAERAFFGSVAQG